VNDGVQIRLAVSRRHSPFLSRCEDSITAQWRQLPHDIEKARDGMRAHRVLITIAGVADSLIDSLFFPVGIQFVRNYHRQSSPNHRTHLPNDAPQRTPCISGDSYKGVRWQRGTIGIRSTGCGVVVPQRLG